MAYPLILPRRRINQALVTPGSPVGVPRREDGLLLTVKNVVYDGTWCGYERGQPGVYCEPNEFWINGVFKQLYRLRFTTIGTGFQIRFEDDQQIPGWDKIGFHWANGRPYTAPWQGPSYQGAWDPAIYNQILDSFLGVTTFVSLFRTDNPVGPFFIMPILPDIPALVNFLKGEGWDTDLTSSKSFFVQYDGGFHWTREEIADGTYQSAPGALVSDINDGLRYQNVPIP